MAKRSNFSRRDFLKTSGASAAALSAGVWSDRAAAQSSAASARGARGDARVDRDDRPPARPREAERPVVISGKCGQ